MRQSFLVDSRLIISWYCVSIEDEKTMFNGNSRDLKLNFVFELHVRNKMQKNLSVFEQKIQRPSLQVS